MDLHVVHGNQLEEDGSITAEFITRIMKALTAAKSTDIVIITGGVTRAGFKSEAEAASDFIFDLNREPLPIILLEMKSTTSGENITMMRDLVIANKLSPNRFFVYHRSSAIPKTKILYRKLWLECKHITFRPCWDSSGIIYRVLEYTLIVFLAEVDPHEKSLFWRWFKRRKRNFTG